MSDATQTAALIGIATILGGIAAGMSFVGAIRDDTAVVTDLINKERLGVEAATARAARRRTRIVVALITLWFTSLAVNLAALLVALLS